jgi:hypothetical protein
MTLSTFLAKHIKPVRLAGTKRPSSTGTSVTALTARAVTSPGLAQGSGTLQANEAISYGSVPLQYAKSPVPNPKNVGVPLAQHTNFATPTTQRATTVQAPKLRNSARALDQRNNFRS